MEENELRIWDWKLPLTLVGSCRADEREGVDWKPVETPDGGNQ